MGVLLLSFSTCPTQETDIVDFSIFCKHWILVVFWDCGNSEGGCSGNLSSEVMWRWCLGWRAGRKRCSYSSSYWSTQWRMRLKGWVDNVKEHDLVDRAPMTKRDLLITVLCKTPWPTKRKHLNCDLLTYSLRVSPCPSWWGLWWQADRKAAWDCTCVCVEGDAHLLYSLFAGSQTWCSCLSLPVLKFQAAANSHTWQEKSSNLETCEASALERARDGSGSSSCTHPERLSPQNAHHAHRDSILPRTKSSAVGDHGLSPHLSPWAFAYWSPGISKGLRP